MHYQVNIFQVGTCSTNVLGALTNTVNTGHTAQFSETSYFFFQFYFPFFNKRERSYIKKGTPHVF